MPQMLGAVGIGCSNMEKSVAFYKTILDMVPIQTFDVEAFTETVLAMPHRKGGSQIILMQYKNRPAGVQDPPGKLVFYVEDVKETLEKCTGLGCEVVHPLGTGEGWIKSIAMVKDLDGLVLEFMPLSLLKGAGALGTKI